MLDAAGHRLSDLGDDFYTVGRPHPMIDPALRNPAYYRSGFAAASEGAAGGCWIGYEGATADLAASLAQTCRKRVLRELASKPLFCHCDGHRHRARSAVPFTANCHAGRCRYRRGEFTA